VQRLLWDALPFVLAALAVLKLAAASRVATRLGRSGLLNDRQLLAAVACWCAVTMIAYGALAWFIGTPLFPRYVLMALAVLGVPFLRLAHAPRALAARRHG
jgi:hypothetical protein